MHWCKLAIYYPILMKFVTQTERNMLNPENANQKCAAIIKDGRRDLENQCDAGFKPFIT
jgi:hypothetical protein